jgi:hypothetical protein
VLELRSLAFLVIDAGEFLFNDGPLTRNLGFFSLNSSKPIASEI